MITSVTAVIVVVVTMVLLIRPVRVCTARLPAVDSVGGELTPNRSYIKRLVGVVVAGMPANWFTYIKVRFSGSVGRNQFKKLSSGVG